MKNSSPRSGSTLEPTRSKTARVLVVDDEASLLEMLAIVLQRSGYEVSTASDEVGAIAAFKREQPDLVLLDLVLGGPGGLEVLRQMKQLDPTIPVVVITAYSTWDNAVEAMRLGAYDFVKKPFEDNQQVREVVSRALAQRAQLTQAERRNAKSEILGNSPAIRSVLDVVERVAPTDTTVLIMGESGTGKELLARAVHYCSHRAQGPFLSVNCGAFPETLLESELFGHVKGAFSGAVSEKKGLIEVCDQGTFFLDEIGELSMDTQVKLLRVLEDRACLPVGGTVPKRIDVRFMCATNKDLEEQVRKGRFRSDLYYRINVVPIRIPPLRERKKDIPLLAAHFLAKYAASQGKEIREIGLDVQDALLGYDWPGNVRELENTVQRAVTLTRADTLQVVHLQIPTGGGRARPVQVDLPPEGVNLERLLEELERGYLLAALEQTKGNVTQAAKLLGISFRQMRYKLKKYDLDRHATE